MLPRLHYVPCHEWPPLAWLAQCRRGRSDVIVHHGAGVETQTDFFCEAAWDGEFVDANFDRTDIVIGSGARLRAGELTFVSAGNAVDRLHTLTRGDRIWISNSLVCLLAATATRCDPLYPRYYEFFLSVVDGVERYQRRLPCAGGGVELVYFKNLRWNGVALDVVDKPGLGRDFSDFARFSAFLETSMRRLIDNATSLARKRRYALLGTLSSGYDSATVCALARDFGLRKVISFDTSHDGRDDSGAATAHALGLTPIKLGTRDWRELNFPEVPFVAGDAIGEEARFAAAQPHLQQTVLFTGHPGDRFWGKLPYRPVDPHLSRGDTAGVSLTEYRLWAGFLHCAVPFWGGRQFADIVRISNSAEMRPWDTHGDYSRPICRRIVEARGVPREAFGAMKRNASVFMHNFPEFLTPRSLASYVQWLREHRGRSLVGPKLDRVCFLANRVLARGLAHKPLLWRVAGKLPSRPTAFRRYLFPWAMASAMRRYSATAVDPLITAPTSRPSLERSRASPA